MSYLNKFFEFLADCFEIAFSPTHTEEATHMDYYMGREGGMDYWLKNDTSFLDD